jgi:hypothetical protein
VGGHCLLVAASATQVPRFRQAGRDEHELLGGPIGGCCKRRATFNETAGGPRGQASERATGVADLVTHAHQQQRRQIGSGE